jgi:hypothetical protein
VKGKAADSITSALVKSMAEASWGANLVATRTTALVKVKEIKKTESESNIDAALADF